MHILMIFIDGIGLGDDDPSTNPFVAAELPILNSLANGQKWIDKTGMQHSERAVFIPTDPRLGVEGRPQSGTGQAALVTGLNIPQMIGEHYGPKPNEATRDILDQQNIFKTLVSRGKTASLLEAYPPRWHKGINSGKRLPASYQYAVRSADLPFYGIEDFRAGRAMSGDWTGKGWRTEMGYTDTPLLTPYEAGIKMVQLSRQVDFAFFAHWLTDIIGHRGTLPQGIDLLETIDAVMTGVLDEWDDSEGLVILTSDHGNMEKIGNRNHTLNDVPTLIIGEGREAFSNDLHDLTGFVSRIESILLD